MHFDIPHVLPLVADTDRQPCAFPVLLQNPTQDAVIDPVRGVTKKEGHSPGHKIQMRPSEQVRLTLSSCLAHI